MGSPLFAEQLLAQNKIDERHPLHLNVLYDDAPLHVNIAQRVVGQLTQSDMLRWMPNQSIGKHYK